MFPGSFDPFTIGHYSVVQRALSMFDRVVIGIGVNSSKNYLFTIEQRKEYINSVFKDLSDRVEVVSYSGLTVDYCRENGIKFIIRGIRNTRDFVFENEIAGMNHTLNSTVETVFLASYPEHTVINATIVREIIKSGGDASGFLPPGVRLPNFTK